MSCRAMTDQLLDCIIALAGKHGIIASLFENCIEQLFFITRLKVTDIASFIVSSQLLSKHEILRIHRGFHLESKCSRRLT